MRVRMLVQISGGRGDGTVWPGTGGELVVGDDEGRQLCAAGLAVPVPEERKAEKAVPAADPAVEERATPKRPAPPKS